MWSDLFKEEKTAREFWQQALQIACETTGASNAYLYLKDHSGETPVWKVVAVRPSGNNQRSRLKQAMSIFETLLEDSNDGIFVQTSEPEEADSGVAEVFGAVRLNTSPQEMACVLLISAPVSEQIDLAHWRRSLEWLQPLPEIFHFRSRLAKAEGDVRRVAAALDLMLMLNEETRFVAAGMRLCNELATRERFIRVSLGWLENEEIRLKALNHSEKFEKKMELVRRMECAMEECFDQDEEIVWPDDESGQIVTREHAEFAKESGSTIILSLPLRVAGKCVGVLFCERDDADQPITEGQLEQLRIYGDQLTRRLDDLHRRDRWLGGFLWLLFRERLSHWMGPRHVGWKLAGVVTALLLLILVFGRMTYRVEAPFILQSDQAVFITAPFDGYLKDTLVEVGDRVQKGAPLAQFDDRELRLEEVDLRAQISSYLRQSEKARSENKVAEMRINRAKIEELQARVAIIERRLKHAEIKTPIHGVVIEGDLRENLGAPFKRGDLMFRISGLEQVYIEAQIDERDIDEIDVNTRMELAFTSRPDLTFENVLKRLDPVAIAEQEGNRFLGKSAEIRDFPEWWRPGMSGVAKIEAGTRTFLWILTHRTIDFLRLKLWI